ncbi:PDZ domain-containing protein [Candidatus Uhrbacteria bacterium]|nr:PDZ domain-containing protein [Candidatus Uhrbacteria bacterium]
MKPFIIAGCLVLGLIGGLLGNSLGQENAKIPQNPLTQIFSGEETTVALVKRSLPAVVSISIRKQVTDFFGNTSANKIRVGGGSGFFVTNDGMIVTNKHVINDLNAEFTVMTQEGKEYSAKVLARDPVLDLAFLKIDVSHVPALELGDSDRVEIGQSVIAIGNALAEFQNTVTQGIISGVHRRLVAGGLQQTEVIEEAIQTDAAINPGNSGGPLIDSRGFVIGVNTAISENAQSLGFALPINAVKQALSSVQKTGRIVRAWIGVRYVQIDQDLATRDTLPYNYGALIVRGTVPRDTGVMPGSPAAKAGLVEGDIILEMNGQKLDQGHTLSSVIAKLAPGDKLTLKVAREGKERQVELILEERK